MCKMWLVPPSKVGFEKTVFAQVFKKFSARYTNRTFIAMFIQTLCPCSSPTARDQVQHSCHITAKITFLYFSVFIIFDSQISLKRLWTEWTEWTLAVPEFSLFLIALRIVIILSLSLHKIHAPCYCCNVRYLFFHLAERDYSMGLYCF
jgi:hypothetical protein